MKKYSNVDPKVSESSNASKAKTPQNSSSNKSSISLLKKFLAFFAVLQPPG